MNGRPPKGIENLTDEQKLRLNDKEWLTNEHHTNRKTLRTISAELGIGRWHLTSIFRMFDIPIKKFPHISIETGQQLNDVELLKKLHYNNKLTIEDIAQKFGVKSFTIARRFRENGIVTERFKEQSHKRRQETCKKKYGVSSIKQLHIPEDTLNKLANPDWIYEQHITLKKSCVQIAEDLGLERTIIDNRLREHGIEKKYYRRSIDETHIVDFIQSFYDGEVKTNIRNVICPGEIDVYLPEHKLAIEYNGLYWHTTEYYPSRSYHKAKTDKCEKAGIRLFHIMEDEWETKQEIWKSIIKNSLGYHDLRIYARDTVIVEVPLEKRKAFLKENHLQGDVGCTVCLGLEWKGELVSLMSFGKPRFNKKHEWELLRYCSKLNVSVVGGASKLYTNFVRKVNPQSVISYADRRHGTGLLYGKLGFSFLGTTEPNYGYLIGDKLELRYLWQKHKLPKKLKVFDPNLSEQANMKANGFYRVYDSGNSIFSWHK